MSSDIAKARQQLAQVRTNVKLEQFVPAAQAFQFALEIMLKTNLLKSERDQFEKMITEALDYFTYCDAIQKIYPMTITYTPGNERQLLELIKGLIDELSRVVLEDAQIQMQAKEEKKRQWLARGLQELGTLPMKGQATLAALLREYPDDPLLRAGVGEAYLRAGLYEQAVQFLTEALDMKPDMLPFYNSIAMALRKLSRFDVAESYYLRASKYMRHDPNLYFNIGRLYVDWKKWPKAIQAGKAALKLKPDFIEAQKLIEYAEHQDKKHPIS